MEELVKTGEVRFQEDELMEDIKPSAVSRDTRHQTHGG